MLLARAASTRHFCTTCENGAPHARVVLKGLHSSRCATDPCSWCTQARHARHYSPTAPHPRQELRLAASGMRDHAWQAVGPQQLQRMRCQTTLKTHFICIPNECENSHFSTEQLSFKEPPLTHEPHCGLVVSAFVQYMPLLAERAHSYRVSLQELLIPQGS